jgi:hypothetical protein
LKENGMARVFLASVIAAAFFANAYASPSAKRIETTGDPRLDGILSNFTWGSPDLMYAFPSEPIARQPKDILFEPLPDEQLVNRGFRQKTQLLLMLRRAAIQVIGGCMK